MFKQAFQGGPFIPLLEVKGQTPAQGWNTKKASVTRTYNKEMKTYVLDISGQVGSKITMPEAPEKQTLGITQSYFILQLFIPKDQAFSLNLGILDYMKNRIRLHFSTANKTVKITSLHARLPLHAVADTWSCLVFDLAEITRSCFPTSEYASLGFIEIMPSCTILRILTAKACPLPTLELYCPRDEEDARSNPRMPKPRFSLRQHVPLDKKVEVGQDVHVQILDEFYLSLFREGKVNTDLAVRDQETLLEARQEFIPGYKESAETAAESSKSVKQVQLGQGSSMRGNKQNVAPRLSEDKGSLPERNYNILPGNPHCASQSTVAKDTDTGTRRMARQIPKLQGTNSIKAAIDFNAEKQLANTAGTTGSATLAKENIDSKMPQSKLPCVNSPKGSDVQGMDLTLNAIPVILKPEQCGKSAISANGVTTDRSTTPVFRNKDARVGLVDDELLGSMADTANYAVMGNEFVPGSVPVPDKVKDKAGQVTKSIVDGLVLSNNTISQSLVDTVFSSMANADQPDSEDIEGYDCNVDDLGGNFIENPSQAGSQVTANDDSYSYYSDDASNDANIPDPALDANHPSVIPEPASNLRLAANLSEGIRYDAHTGAYLEIDDANIPGPMDD